MWIILGIIAGIIVLALIIAAIIHHNSNRGGDDSPGTDFCNRAYTPAPEDHESFGRHGERVVFKMLSTIASECEGYAYENVAFIDDDGYSTEIDAILICPGGFFVIEVKSNKGIITGDINDEQWCAEKEEWQDDKDLKNPVKQNQGHINHLRRMAGKGFPYITSLVIFPYAKNIESVRSVIVHDYYSAQDYIRSKIAEGKYKKTTVDRFNDQLKSFLSRYGITHEQHLRNLDKHNYA